MGFTLGRENWRVGTGGGIEPCRLGKRCGWPGGIWEALLRFIGVGILWTWGIIHGKASLSGSVYTMRQGWQRWRPSTTGPSCLNMGLSHLTHPKRRSNHWASRKEIHTSWWLAHQTWSLTVTLQVKLVLFRGERLFLKQTKGIFDLFSHCISFCLTHLLLWGLDEYVLTITLHVYTINYTVTRDLGSLFTKPWQRSVYSAISPKIPPYFIYSY